MLPQVSMYQVLFGSQRRPQGKHLPPKKNQATKTTPSTRYLSGAWHSLLRIGKTLIAFG